VSDSPCFSLCRRRSTATRAAGEFDPTSSASPGPWDTVARKPLGWPWSRPGRRSSEGPPARSAPGSGRQMRPLSFTGRYLLGVRPPIPAYVGNASTPWRRRFVSPGETRHSCHSFAAGAVPMRCRARTREASGAGAPAYLLCRASWWTRWCDSPRSSPTSRTLSPRFRTSAGARIRATSSASFRAFCSAARTRR
jgi:hypothetical protein